MNLKYVLCIELSVNAAHFVDLIMQFVENGHSYMLGLFMFHEFAPMKPSCNHIVHQ